VHDVGANIVFVLVVLLISCFLHFANGNSTDTNADSGSALAQAVWSLVYAGAFIGLVMERRRAWPLMRKSWPILALIVLVALSSLWSSDPALTAKRAFGLLGTTALSYYAVCRFQLRTFVNLLGISSAIAALLSLIAVVALPSLGIMHGEEYPGTWQGIFDHKNDLGEAMSLGIITLLAVAVESTGKRRRNALAAILLCGLLLVGSQSATAFVSTLFGAGIVAIALLWRSKRHRGLVRTVTIVAVLIAGVFAFDAQGLMALLGRDASLTGRTDIWPVAISGIADHPLFGYGYGVFWLPDGPYTDYLASSNWEFWNPVHAHNGFLQLALDVGLVGTTMFALTFVWAGWRSIKYAATGIDKSSIWPLAAIATFALANMTDVSIAAYNNLYWAIFVAAFLYLFREPMPKTILSPLSARSTPLLLLRKTW
jgi:exopolysaccharide production protein ExoQ